VVPVTKDGRIILIRQYRYAGGGYLYEIPAGTLNKGERPIDCARREIVEEIGYKARRFTRLKTILTTPGFTNEKIHIYLAEDLVPARSKLDADEVIEVRIFKKDEVIKMIWDGKIKDAKSLIGLYSFLYDKRPGTKKN